MSDMSYNVKSVFAEDVIALYPRLPKRANKGSCGRVLAICGSYDRQGAAMSGAAYFSASAAYRSGAGIVEIFTAEEIFSALASSLPEAVYSLYGNGEQESEICARVKRSLSLADCVIIGCGLGKSKISRAILKTVIENADCPLVLDADALNIISENQDMLSLLPEAQRHRTVVTPHPREMMRLCGKSVDEILKSTVATAVDFAREYQIICLLKDNQTVISDGEAAYVNHSGNPGMASAGMGDILSGIIGAMLARENLKSKSGRDEPDYTLSVAVAAYIHGIAGDMARDEFGEYSLMASDLLAKIPNAISKYCSCEIGKTNKI